MNVGRPPGGFNIVVGPGVSDYITGECAANHRVEQCWHDLLDRIKITALREGTRLAHKGAPRFTFVAEGAPHFMIPTIQIVYECFGDKLSVVAALVWNDADHDSDDEGDSNMN